MCGSLKLEKQDKLIPTGSYIPARYIAGSADSEYKWDGFARSDGSQDGSKAMVNQWDPHEWKITAVKADQFTERQRSTGKTFLFNSSRIACLISTKYKELKILTREARTQQERDIHHRMPVRIPKDWSMQQFLQFMNDKLNSDYQLI